MELNIKTIESNKYESPRVGTLCILSYGVILTDSDYVDGGIEEIEDGGDLE